MRHASAGNYAATRIAVKVALRIKTFLHASGAFPADVAAFVGWQQVSIIMVDLAIALVTADSRLIDDFWIDHVYSCQSR